MDSSPVTDVHEDMEKEVTHEKLSKSQLKRMKKKAKKDEIKASEHDEEVREEGMLETGNVSDEDNVTKNGSTEIMYLRNEGENGSPRDENVKSDDNPQLSKEEAVSMSPVRDETEESIKNIANVSDIVELSDNGKVYGGYLYKKPKTKTFGLWKSWSNRFVSVNIESGLLMVFDHKDSYNESGLKAKSIANTAVQSPVLEPLQPYSSTAAVPAAR